ncbi:MAG: hypothetical protein M3Z41_04955 [Candidatus Eremiobacteraeota bacterium]|nr:hypothetical protein [Candidatus Eremiobacteraeota bacterium]
MNFPAISKLQAAAATIVAVTAVTVAACGGGGGATGFGGCLGYGGGGGGSTGTGNCVGHPLSSPTPATAAQPVGLLLTGESAVTVAPYGSLVGFFNGTNGNAPNGSGTVHLTANMTVQFHNVEATGGQPHTASFIQTWGGSFPASPTIPTTASAAGTSISSAGFSSGNLNPGAVSAVYNAGGAGMFIFGCAYHYSSNGMRTVVIVQ